MEDVIQDKIPGPHAELASPKTWRKEAIWKQKLDPMKEKVRNLGNNKHTDLNIVSNVLSSLTTVNFLKTVS